MTASFNLLDEPWIRVTRLDGAPDEVSLLSLFREATDIAGIHGEIASQDTAVLRLLLAICHRAMDGPEDLDIWEEYWRDPGSLGRDAVDHLERHRERFDLRDPDRPFFQVAGIRAASGKLWGLKSLIADVPNNNPLFTTRIAEGLESIGWAEAARWLVHVHAFDPAGIRSGAVGDPLAKKGRSFPIGTGWAGQIGTVTVMGENLERTLLLNAVVCKEIPDLVDVDPEEDLAPWEREPDGPARAPAREPLGPVDCYTWQTRRVLLHGDDDGVTGLFLGNGDRAKPQNRYRVEPMTAWRYSEPQSRKLKAPVYMPCKLPTDRAFWRGLSTLVTQLSPPITVKGAGKVTPYRSPGVVSFYRELMYHEIVPASGLIPLHAVGIEYGSNESTVAELVCSIPGTGACSPSCEGPWRRRRRSPTPCGAWPGTWTARAAGARTRAKTRAGAPPPPSTRSLTSTSPAGSPLSTRRTPIGPMPGGASCCAPRPSSSRRRSPPPCRTPPSPDAGRARIARTWAGRCSSSATP